MAACSALAVDRLFSAEKRMSCNMPFSCPRTVKVDHIEFCALGQIDRCAHYGINGALLAAVFKSYRACDNVIIFKNAVRKEYMKILYCICKFDFKCVDLVALLGVCSRKSLQCRLAACYFM